MVLWISLPPLDQTISPKVTGALLKAPEQVSVIIPMVIIQGGKIVKTRCWHRERILRTKKERQTRKGKNLKHVEIFSSPHLLFSFPKFQSSFHNLA